MLDYDHSDDDPDADTSDYAMAMGMNDDEYGQYGFPQGGGSVYGVIFSLRICISNVFLML